MSTQVSIQSACGRITTSIDLFDLELNPHGVVCCPECELIIESRDAWLGVCYECGTDVHLYPDTLCPECASQYMSDYTKEKWGGRW
jgi:hypothetical protein